LWWILRFEVGWKFFRKLNEILKNINNYLKKVKAVKFQKNKNTVTFSKLNSALKFCFHPTYKKGKFLLQNKENCYTSYANFLMKSFSMHSPAMN
jgi:hypothetical protein